MYWGIIFDWLEILIFCALLLMSIYVLSSNEIRQMQKIYVPFFFAMMFWPFGQFSLKLTDQLHYQWAYLNASFIGLVLISYLWLVISFLFAQRWSRFHRFLLKLAAVPSLVIAVCITLNPLFGWFAEPLYGGYIYRSYGPVFWVMAALTSGYVLLGCVLLLSSLRNRSGTMRNQVILLVVGQILLLAFSALDTMIHRDIHHVERIVPGLTSAGILLSYLCFAVAVHRYSVYKAVSLAHHAVINSMETGLVVVSDDNTVIDMNQTARRFTAAKVGKTFPIHDCIECMDPEDVEDFLQVYTHKPMASIQAALSCYQPALQHVLMRIYPIKQRQRCLGRIITFQDITEWRSMVDELNSKNRDLFLRNQELTRIQQDLSDANKKLEQLATTDSLTGCYNRRYLYQMMEYQISVDARYGAPFSLILLDIDYFKQTNDKYGHQIGDLVLRHTADLISSRLRKTDILARYGGEEFAVFLPHTRGEQAVRLAEELRSLVAESAVDTEQGRIAVTISIGVASSEDLRCPEDIDIQTCIEELFRKADLALYQAKNLGRNRIAASKSCRSGGTRRAEHRASSAGHEHKNS